MSERALCQRVIADRLGTIKVREVQAAAARGIAGDPSQSVKTRTVRGNEARALELSITDLRKRVDPAHGGALVCVDEFPDPGLF